MPRKRTYLVLGLLSGEKRFEIARSGVSTTPKYDPLSSPAIPFRLQEKRIEILATSDLLEAVDRNTGE